MNRIFLIFSFVIAFFVAGAQKNDAVLRPEIKFQKKVFDYDTIAYGGNGHATFVFTNVGGSPLVLSNVKATCGCTVPSWPAGPIPPQATDSIIVVYNTYRSGAFNNGIIVYSNATTESVRLIVKGVVENPSDK